MIALGGIVVAFIIKAALTAWALRERRRRIEAERKYRILYNQIAALKF